MIKNKKDLHFYIAADRIMNGYPAFRGLKTMIKETYAIGGGKILIIRYLRHLRRYAYYYNIKKRTLSWNTIMMIYEHYKVAKLGIKCGFSIGQNSLGYGVVIPHYGTIVINSEARVGNYSVIHTCTCIAGGDKVIGDGFYLSSGSQVVGSLRIGDGVTVAAHSLVNKSFDGNVLIAGAPAVIKRIDEPAWFDSDRDRERFSKYKEQIEELRKKIYG